MASQDVATRVAQEVAAWLDTMPKKVADGLLESVYRPRVVEPTRADALGYYRTILLTPEGYLNEAGRQQLIQQVGAAGYEGIAKALAKALKDEAEESAAPAPGPVLAAAVDHFGPGVPTLPKQTSPATAQAPGGVY